MRKWLEFNLRRPKTVLGFLVVYTIFSILGLGNLEFDSSSESLMPKDDPIYQAGQKAKLDFGDNKTFMVASIEATGDNKLFTPKVFKFLNEMVMELDEYQEFDSVVEDARLQAVMDAGNAKIIPKEGETKTKKAEVAGSVDSGEAQAGEEDLDAQFLSDSNDKKDTSKQKKPKAKANIQSNSAGEEDLDAAFLGGDGGGKDAPTAAATENVSTPQPENPKNKFITESGQIDDSYYNKPSRKRNEYDYDAYKPIKVSDIRAKLDTSGRRVLDTILRKTGLFKEDGDNKELSSRQYKTILEAWEDLYLFKSLEIIDTMIDPITVEDIVGTEEELKPEDLIEEDDNGNRILPKTKKEFAEYKRKLLLNPGYESTVYSLDDKGKVKSLGMSFKLTTQKKYDEFTNYFYPLIKKYDILDTVVDKVSADEVKTMSENFPVDIDVMGSIIFDKFIADFQQRDLGFFMPLVVIVIIITFFLNFRSARGIFLPTITVILGSIWTIGLMGHLGFKLTVIANILPPLLIAIGSSYSIHIFNQYLIELDYLHEGEKKERLLNVMNHISTTVFLAGFTTFVSFMTLTVNQVTGLREFGIFAALGSAFSVVISVILIPSALMIMKLLPLKKTKADIESGSDASGAHEGNWIVQLVIRFFSRLSLQHPIMILSAFVILIGVSIVGVTKVKTETAPSLFFKPESEIRRSLSKISENMNGSLVLNLVFDSGKQNGVKDAEFLRYVEGVRNWLDEDEQRDKFFILHNAGFGDFIKRMHMAMNSDNPKFYQIPITSDINDYLEIFGGDDDDSDGRPDAFESTISPDYRKTNLIIRLGERDGQPLGTEMSRKATNHIMAHLRQDAEFKQYKPIVVGEPMNFVVLGDYIVKGQILSIILSTLIVGTVVFLLFRNPWAGLVALIPISSTITMVFGYMGYSGIPLDIAQAILSSIAIGIGVDDTIHFLNTLRKSMKEGRTLEEAIRETHRMAGLAIVYTSIALVFGFAVLLFSSFTPIFNFGFLVSSVMAVTTVAALVFLPAVIYLFKLDLITQKNWAIFKYINLNRFLE